MVAPIVSIRNPDALQQAAGLILAGQPIIVPTDTIYGIANRMTSKADIQRLYDVRGREREPALPFLVASLEESAHLARFDSAALRLARQFWPGPLTLILPAAANLPAYARAIPIAVRVPNCPPLIPLLRMLEGYILATGALRSGYPPAITAQEAANLFEDEVPLVLDGGPSLYGIPSTIIDCLSTPPVVVRRGSIPEDLIQQALGLAEGPTSDRDS